MGHVATAVPRAHCPGSARPPPMTPRWRTTWEMSAAAHVGGAETGDDLFERVGVVAVLWKRVGRVLYEHRPHLEDGGAVDSRLARLRVVDRDKAEARAVWVLH